MSVSLSHRNLKFFGNLFAPKNPFQKTRVLSLFQASVFVGSQDRVFNMAASPKVMVKHVKRKAPRCMYQKYSCSAQTLPSFLFCEKHISEDINAPFSQCSYTYPSTRERCTYPVINTVGNHSRTSGSLCKEHAEEAEASRLKPKSKLLPPLSTADTILSGLSHYIKNSPYYKTRERLVGATADELLEQIEKNKNIVVNPFTDIDATELNSKTNDTLNYSCEPDSDIEAATTDNVWDNAELDSSDPEDLDRSMTDPLRHANVFTDEEMILLARNHAARLQNLCILQYRRLIRILREKRSKYLVEWKREKEIYGLVTKPKNLTLREKKQFDLLKALTTYQKIGTGPEALLFKKMMERRKAVTPGLFARSAKNYTKCVYAEDGIKCTLRCIPTTKFCKKHILHDKKQVLFQECGVQKKDHTCREPVVPLPNTTCVYHSALPDIAPKITVPDTSSSPPEKDQQAPPVQEILDADTKMQVDEDTFEMLSSVFPGSSNSSDNNAFAAPDVPEMSSSVLPNEPESQASDQTQPGSISPLK